MKTALSEVIGIGFISNFLLKARILYLTILKRKSLSLPLKVETDQFVICLVLPECLSVNFVAFYPRTEKRIVTALMPSLRFRCFSLFLPLLRTLAQKKRSENCLRFATGIFFPAVTMAAGAKKILAKRFAPAISEHYRDFKQAYVY